MEQGSPGGIREAISDQWEEAITKPDDLYKVNHMLWTQAHDAKLERGTIRPSVPDNVADFLSSGQKILHADHLVNKDNQAELTYLFQAILDDGKHLQILYCAAHQISPFWPEAPGPARPLGAATSLRRLV